MKTNSHSFTRLIEIADEVDPFANDTVELTLEQLNELLSKCTLTQEEWDSLEQ